jgi:hypothetical protein
MVYSIIIQKQASEENVNICFVNGPCDGNAAAAVQGYRTQFPNWQTPDRGMF